MADNYSWDDYLQDLAWQQLDSLADDLTVKVRDSVGSNVFISV